MRAQHDRPRPRFHVLRAFDGLGRHVLAIRLIDEQHNVARQRAREAVERVALHPRRRRVVRIDNHRDLRPRRHRGEHRVEVVNAVAQRHPDRGRAEQHRVLGKQRERRVGHHDLVAARDERAEQRAHDVVRTVSHQNVLDAETVRLGKPAPQFGVIVVHIHLEIAHRRERRRRFRRRPQRVLVRRQLHERIEPVLLARLRHGRAGRIRLHRNNFRPNDLAVVHNRDRQLISRPRSASPVR